MPGTILSQLGTSTRPSSWWAMSMVSTLSQISSRDARVYFMPTWPMAMPSHTPMAGIRMGRAACHLNAGLDGIGDLVQIHVAGDDLTVGTHHTDEGAVQLFRGVAQCIEQASVGRAPNPWSRCHFSFYPPDAKAPEPAVFLLKPTLWDSTSQSASQTAPLPRGASGEETRLYDMPRPPLVRGGSASALTERFF